MNIEYVTYSITLSDLEIKYAINMYIPVLYIFLHSRTCEVMNGYFLAVHV